MSIKVIRVLHEQSVLNSFGLNDNISVLLSEVPLNVKDAFFIYRLNPEVDIPEIGDRFLKNLKVVDSNMNVDYDFEVKNTTLGIELVINPKQPLMPAQKYALIVSSDIRQEGLVVITKTVPKGPSEILAVSKSPNQLVDKRTYTLTFTADSVLNKKAHVITASLSLVELTGGVSQPQVPLPSIKKDIINDTLIFSDDNVAINAKFGSVPFVNGEVFTVVNNKYLVDQQTKIIAVITANKSVIVEKPAVPLTRLTIGDFNKFYEALNRDPSTPAPPDPTPVAHNTVSFEYRNPNVIRIVLDKTLNKDSLKYQDGVDANGDPVYKYKKCVKFNFDYAFGNYQLERLGQYKTNMSYAVFQDIYANVIEFTIEPLNEAGQDYLDASLIEKTKRYHLLMRKD